MPEEEKIVPNRAGQIARLRDRLAGNAAFGRLRHSGDFHEAPATVVARLVGADGMTPSAVRSGWEDAARDVSIMAHLYAQLRRDGWGDAAEELAHALRDPYYVIEGETIPLHETAPLTLLIIDFERTAELIRWVRSARPSSVTNEANPETQRMHGLFPSLRDCITACSPQEFAHPGRSLMDAHLLDVVQPFLEQVRKFPKGTAGLEIERHTCNTGFAITSTHLRHFEFRLGFAIPAEQSEVLALFGREQQNLLSTWQCRIPRVMSETCKMGLMFGFHPEAGHAQFPQGGGYFPSAGCHSGYGAVVLYHPKNIRDYLGRFHRVDSWGGCGNETTIGRDFAFLLDTSSD